MTQTTLNIYSRLPHLPRPVSFILTKTTTTITSLLFVEESLSKKKIDNNNLESLYWFTSHGRFNMDGDDDSTKSIRNLFMGVEIPGLGCPRS